MCQLAGSSLDVTCPARKHGRWQVEAVAFAGEMTRRTCTGRIVRHGGARNDRQGARFRRLAIWFSREAKVTFTAAGDLLAGPTFVVASRGPRSAWVQGVCRSRKTFRFPGAVVTQLLKRVHMVVAGVIDWYGQHLESGHFSSAMSRPPRGRVSIRQPGRLVPEREPGYPGDSIFARVSGMNP